MNAPGVAVDPHLVERLRARAARHPRIAAGDVRRDTLAAVIDDLLEDDRVILAVAERDALVTAVVDEAIGLGPLESLLRDGAVTEIMVVGPDRVFIERGGRIERSQVRFHDEGHLLHVIDRILAPLGRRIDEASPMVDARLPDRRRGSATRRAARGGRDTAAG